MQQFIVVLYCNPHYTVKPHEDLQEDKEQNKTRNVIDLVILGYTNIHTTRLLVYLLPRILHILRTSRYQAT